MTAPSFSLTEQILPRAVFSDASTKRVGCVYAKKRLYWFS